MSSKNKKVEWNQYEDKLLNSLVKRYGTKLWSKMAEQIYKMTKLKRKTGRQCRQRWFNQLDPSLSNNKWSIEEENILFEEHQRYGSKWSIISEKLNGRSQNSIKNHFYSTIRKSLRRMSKFLGFYDSTKKIRKIKPSTLSMVLKVTSTKNDESIFPPIQSQHQIVDQIELKRIAYHFINFSRVKFLDKKPSMKQEDNITLKNLLEDLEKINEKYQIIKEIETKIRRQKNLHKNFDRVPDYETDSDEQEIQEVKGKQKCQIELKIKSEFLNSQIVQELISKENVIQKQLQQKNNLNKIPLRKSNRIKLTSESSSFGKTKIKNNRKISSQTGEKNSLSQINASTEHLNVSNIESIEQRNNFYDFNIEFNDEQLNIDLSSNWIRISPSFYNSPNKNLSISYRDYQEDQMRQFDEKQEIDFK